VNDGLYRRENGIFAFRYKDQRGKWREKYTGTDQRAAASSFREGFLGELRDGIAPAEMAEWDLAAAERWWIAFRKPRIAPATLNSERYRLQHFVRLFPGKRLRDVTNVDLEHYQNARLGGGVANSSVNKEIILWSLIFQRAKLWRRLREDYRPLANRPSDIGKAITREELRGLALVAETRVDWEAAFYGSVLAANTGLRGGEIKKLRIQAVDLSKRRITIRRRDAKTNASARVVELNRDAVVAAERLLLRARCLGANEPQHFLMPKHLSRISHGEHKGERGYAPDQHQVCWDTAWKTLTVKAGLAPLRFHDLRHSFITHMVERGVPIGVVQAMVGHISARMLRHYTHITSGASRRAVELFNDDPIFKSDAPADARIDGQDLPARALPN
jgi:integrase